MGGIFSSEESFPITIRKHKKYGWKPDIPDHRDQVTRLPGIKNSGKIDLRNQNMPNIYTQGNLGSCTANALAAAFSYDQNKQKLSNFSPSRLFIYYNERAIENTISQDSGASIRDGMKVLNKLGACEEKYYPYDTHYYAERPANKAYKNAQEHKSIKYRKIKSNVRDFRTALDLGYPVIFGFSVPESFENEELSKTGIMKNPGYDEAVVGGHAVLACGYDDSMVGDGTQGYLLIRNSWGSEWGQAGYFWMPYIFVNGKNVSDCWILESVKETIVETNLEPIIVEEQMEVVEEPVVEEPEEEQVEEPEEEQVEEPEEEQVEEPVQELYEFKYDSE